MQRYNKVGFSTSTITNNLQLSLTVGVGNIWRRLNCNEFVENLRAYHNFIIGDRQNIANIRSTIPPAFLPDFEIGLNL